MSTTRFSVSSAGKTVKVNLLQYQLRASSNSPKPQLLRMPTQKQPHHQVHMQQVQQQPHDAACIACWPGKNVVAFVFVRFLQWRSPER